MELILWRHAEAEDGEPDMARALTPKGQKQASRMGEWLERNLPANCRILVSPAVRTVQTAQALGRKFKTMNELAPDSTAQAVLGAANWPDSREPVLIVGHQPTLGYVAALIIAGQAQPWTIRKGNVWWVSQRENGEGNGAFIRAVMTSEFAGK